MSRRPLVLAGLVATVVIGCLGGAAAPAVAVQQAPSATQSAHRQPAYLTAKPDKLRIKRGERVTVRGRFAVGHRRAAAAPFVMDTEPLLVQELTASGWTTIETDSCEPDGDFAIQLSFSISADLTLRVFHPETDLYAEAFAEFDLAVF